MYDGSESRVGSRRRFRVFDSVHSSFENVRLDSNRNLTELGHAIFRGVVGVLFDDAFPLRGFSPILLKDAFVSPFLTRS